MMMKPSNSVAYQKSRKILKKMRNYDRVREHDELAFPAPRKEVYSIGKNRKDKECRKGICRRKDG